MTEISDSKESKLELLESINRKANEAALLSRVLPANRYGLAEKLTDLVEITTDIVKIKNVSPEELDSELRERIRRIKVE